MTVTTVHVKKASPASSRRFCVKHSVLCAVLPVNHQERRGNSAFFLLFYQFTVFSKISLSVIINQGMFCCGFWKQIFVGLLQIHFGKLEVFQSCLPLLPGCGVGQSAPAGVRSADRNVPVWSLSNVHYLEKVQFTGTWESLTRRTEGSISEGVYRGKRHFWQFLTHCIAQSYFYIFCVA